MWNLADILKMPSLETYTVKGITKQYDPKRLKQMKRYIEALCPATIDEAWLRDTDARAKQVRDLVAKPGAPKDTVFDAVKAYQKLWRMLLNDGEPPALPIDQPTDAVRPTAAATIDRVEREEKKKDGPARMNEHDWALHFAKMHKASPYGEHACVELLIYMCGGNVRVGYSHCDLVIGVPADCTTNTIFLFDDRGLWRIVDHKTKNSHDIIDIPVLPQVAKYLRTSLDRHKRTKLMPHLSSVNPNNRYRLFPYSERDLRHAAATITMRPAASELEHRAFVDLACRFAGHEPETRAHTYTHTVQATPIQERVQNVDQAFLANLPGKEYLVSHFDALFTPWPWSVVNETNEVVQRPRAISEPEQVVHLGPVESRKRSFSLDDDDLILEAARIIMKKRKII